MYSFTDFPEPLPKKEYEKQENEFLTFLRGVQGIVSVYSIGEVELLGVSDLDYLIIFQGNVEKKHIKKFIGDYFLIDTVLFLNREDISNINYVSHHFSYRLVQGKDLWLSFDKKNRNLNIIYSWKVCFFSLLRNFYIYKYNQNISVKNLLSQINDMRYPICFLRNLGVERKKYDDFIEKFSLYRKKYFEHNDYQELSVFLSQAIDLSWDIVEDISVFLEKKPQGQKIYGRFPTVFLDFQKISSCRKESEMVLVHIGKYSRFLYLPTWFYHQTWWRKLSKDLEKITKNNPTFLNFWLDSFLLNFFLFWKKIIDYVIMKTLCKKN